MGQVVFLPPAASSSIGLAAIRVARVVGAVPIALTHRSHKRGALLSAAAFAVVAAEERDISATILELTDGKRAGLLFDLVGRRTFPKLVDSLKTCDLTIVYEPTERMLRHHGRK